MNAGIRTATSHRGYMVAQQFLKALINDLLNRWCIFLHLPSTIIGALI